MENWVDRRVQEWTGMLVSVRMDVLVEGLMDGWLDDWKDG